MNFKLFSHPGVLLKDHLTQVTNTGISRFSTNRVFMEYAQLFKVILSFHDLGKGSGYFQRYLLDNAPRTNLTRHSEFSAIWAYYYCLTELKLEGLDCLLVYVCVISHHADMDNFSELLSPNLSADELMLISENTDYEELNAILSDLEFNTSLSTSLFEQVLSYRNKHSLLAQYRKIRERIDCHHWLCLNYLFSLLIWADKYSAIFQHDLTEDSSSHWHTEYLDNYKNSLPLGVGCITKIRNEAYYSLAENLKNSIRTYSINMPTGSGKTISSLKVALELKQRNPELQRIIYSLPFTSIIDQNQKVFEAILQMNSVEISSDLILAHHHLAEYEYQSDNEYSSNEAEYLVETWDSELVVTTFVQLLASCLSIKNSSLKRFHRLSNAVIILDEIQNIPHYYWALLRHVFKLITLHMNCVIILVTATLPMIYNHKEDEVVELASRKNTWFASLNRVELHRNLLDKVIDIKELANLIARDYQQDKSLYRLIILNTIQSSLDLYRMLSDMLTDTEFIYLSSNVIPKQRLDRIVEIKKHFYPSLIIVSTQVVEAGVDIDVDVVYRDLAPLDSIIQASGRCNRNEAKGCSKVVLFQLAKDKRPFWRYIYDETLVQATIKTIGTGENPIRESELHEKSKQYYEYLNMAASTDKSKRIINNLCRLNLSSALHFHAQNNPEAFNLIDSYPTQTVFIACDAVSSKLLEDYDALLKATSLDRFSKRAALKKMIRKMSPYLVNVDKHLINSEDPIHIIDKDNVAQYYDLKTGFKRKLEQADFIF